jgi:hypothetical protein
MIHEDGECTRQHIDAAMERIRSDLRLLAEELKVLLQRIDDLRSS